MNYARPGWRLYALILPFARFVSSIAVSTFAALDWKYASKLVYLSASGCAIVSKFTPVPMACEMLDTKTTRGVNPPVPAASNFGASSFVSRKGVMWSVAIWLSRLSGVSLNGPAAAAALWMRTLGM